MLRRERKSPNPILRQKGQDQTRVVAAGAGRRLSRSFLPSLPQGTQARVISQTRDPGLPQIAQDIIRLGKYSLLIEG